MKERMVRVLFLFNQQGIRNVVLGIFGAGVFRNDVDTGKVISGHDGDGRCNIRGIFRPRYICRPGTKTFNTFKEAFEEWAITSGDSSF